MATRLQCCAQHCRRADDFFLVMAPPAGIEPATTGLEIRCSVQLSYGGKYYNKLNSNNLT